MAKSKDKPELNLTINLDALTIDDLEMLSKMSEGGPQVAGWEMISFLKRIVEEDIGHLPSDQLEGIIVLVAEAIKAEQDPEDSSGKN